MQFANSMNYWCKNTQCVLHTGVSSLIHIEFNIVELTTLFIKLFSKLLSMIKSSMIHLNDFNEVHNQNQNSVCVYYTLCSMVNQWLLTIDYIQWIDYSSKIYHNYGIIIMICCKHTVVKCINLISITYWQ